MEYFARWKYEGLSRRIFFSFFLGVILFENYADAATSVKILQQISPQYPDSERAARHEGRAVVSVKISRNGSVVSAEIVQSSGWPILDNAAINAARSWKYTPAQDDLGNPIEGAKKFAVSFSLKDTPALNEESLEQLLSKWGGLVEQRQTLLTTLSHCFDRNIRTAEAKSLSEAYEDILTPPIEELGHKLQIQLGKEDIADPIADMLERRKSLEKNAMYKQSENFDSWTADEQKSICNQVIDRLNQGLHR